ncbi:MAG: lysine--tRNA ligase [Desulfatibacillaceae bacterium]|nr:lysine--tRNA ligase [Desulfatibacillaceae bacterium]
MKPETEIRKEKLNNLRQAGVDPFPNDFVPVHTVEEVKLAGEKAASQQNQEQADGSHAMQIAPDQGGQFVLAGRVMAINSFGKSAFLRFKDATGQLQAYIKKDDISAEDFAVYKQMDMGDFAGFSGTLFTTRTGELTLAVKNLRLLSKALRPLPEKFHGLKDPEKRYRRRYLDLIANPGVKEIFVRRAKTISALRAFLEERGFLEVETPMMQPIAGGAEAAPFKTHHNALDMDLYLRIAPELYLKRLVVGGLERVFEINRNFRNEGISTRHNPEFTMLEFYQAYATYKDLIELSQEMFAFVAQKVVGQTKIVYQGSEIDFAPPWKSMSLAKALEEIGGLDPAWLGDREKLIAFAREKGVPVNEKARTGKIVTKLFDVLVEPSLVAPTFITGYPVEVSPLSRRSSKDPDLTERFELFIAGREIANGFSELNDPDDQRGRFLQQMADKDAGDEEAHSMDEDYIEALEYGMPPTAGQGVGIDRLVMLLADCPSIRDVIFFPQLRPGS